MTLSGAITFLPSTDLEATRAFYGGTLGLELALDQAACLIFRVASGGFWGFCQAETGHADPQKTILTIVTDDVDDWYALLASRGVSFDGPPRENPQYKIYHFFAVDPNGYRIEFQRFLDERWSG